MKKDNFMSKAIDKCTENLEYVIAACEFDETGNIDNSLLHKLYVARDLVYMTYHELKNVGAI